MQYSLINAVTGICWGIIVTQKRNDLTLPVLAREAFIANVTFRQGLEKSMGVWQANLTSRCKGLHLTYKPKIPKAASPTSVHHLYLPCSCFIVSLKWFHCPRGGKNPERETKIVIARSSHFLSALYLASGFLVLKAYWAIDGSNKIPVVLRRK